MPELKDNPANLQVLYNTVSAIIPLGSFDGFATRMESQRNRGVFFQQVNPQINLGNYNTFNEKVSSSYKKPSFWQELKRNLEITAKKIPPATIGSFAERIAAEGGAIKFGEKILRSTNPFMIPNMIAEEILPKLPDEQKKKFIESHPAYQWGRKLREVAKKKIQQDVSLQRPAGYREWTFGNMFAPDKLGETIGSVVPSVLVSTGIGVGTAVLTKSPIAGLGAAATVAYGMESGFAYDDAIEYGLKPEEASRVANTVGVINAALEILPVGRAISKMKIGKQVQKSLAKRLIAKGAYKEIPKEMFKQAVTEGVTETFQELNSIVQESGYKGRLPSWLEIGERATQAGFGGFIGGGGVGVVSGTVQQQKAKKALPFIKEEQVDLTKTLESLSPTAKSAQVFKTTIEQGIKKAEEVPYVEEIRKSKATTPEEKSKRITYTQTRIDKELSKPSLTLKEVNPLIRKRTNTLIKEKIKYLKRGERLSNLDTKDNLEQLKMLIVEKARMDLPKSDITRGQIKPLLTQIAKAKTIKEVEEAQQRIDDISEKVDVKTGIAKIDKLLTKYKPKKIDGKLRGTVLTPIEYKSLSDIRNIVKAKPEHIQQAMGSILEKSEVLDEQSQELLDTYQMFGNLKEKTSEEIKTAIDELQSIIDTGRSKKSILRKAEFRKKQNLKQMTLDVVTGKVGGKPIPEHEYIGSELDKRMGGIGGYLLKQQSFEWLLDIASRRDKTSSPLKSKINKRYGEIVYNARQANNILSDRYHRTIHSFLKDNYDMDGKRLGSFLNNNSKIVKNTNIYIGEKEVSMSKNQAYKKWLEWQDPTLRETFEKNGYTEKTIAQIENFIGNEVLSWAEYQLNELYPAIYEEVNEVFKDIYGIDLPFNPFYTPIFRELSRDMTHTDEVLLRDTDIHSTVLNNHLKSRTKSIKPLEFRDGDAILEQYITQMAHFISWAKPVHEMRQVLQSPEVGRALSQYHSPRLKTQIDKHIDDLARGGADKAKVWAGLDKFRSNFTKAVLGVNPVVFMKQLMSFPAYMMEIPSTKFISGVKDFMTDPIKKGKILMGSPMMQARYRVGFERDIMLAMKKATPRALSETKNLSDTLLFFTKLGDRTAILFGGWSVYKYHYDNSRKSGMTHEQAHQKALTGFGMATTRAQQAGNIEDLGDIQRAGSWARLFTMFMTAPNQYYRSAYGAYRNLKAGRGTKTENLKRFAIAHFVLPMMFQFAASGFRWENEKQVRAFLVGSLNGLLILGDIVEGLLDAMLAEASYGYDGVPLASGVNQLYRVSGGIGKALREGFSTEEILEIIHNFASGGSKFVGIPYDPLYRISKGVTDLGKGELQDPRQLLGYTEYALGLKDEKKSRKRKPRQKRKRR